jgi:hypothetical protein
MSVRPTQTKSGYPRRSRAPYPTDDQGQTTEDPPGPSPAADPVEPGAEQVDGRVPGTETGSRVADRRTQRAVRRTRRNVAIVCGLVVALSLIITILIVNMARIRTSGPQVVVSPAAVSIGPSRAAPVPFLANDPPIPGAPASEGGNP